MPTLSNLQELEAQRQQLLSQKQSIVKAHNQQLAKVSNIIYLICNIDVKQTRNSLSLITLLPFPFYRFILN